MTLSFSLPYTTVRKHSEHSALGSSALPYSASELIAIVNTIEYDIYGTLEAYAKKKKPTKKQFMASSAYFIIYINAYSFQFVQECINLQGQNLYFFATKGIAYCKFSHCKMQYFLWVESLCFGFPGVSASTKRLLVHWLDP